VRREGLPPRAAWPGIAGFGAGWFGIYMVALNWGEQRVDAGTASMTTSSIPLMVVLLSWLAWRSPGCAGAACARVSVVSR
jgi:drug/metabolite transporter (DMT)-like permease